MTLLNSNGVTTWQRKEALWIMFFEQEKTYVEKLNSLDFLNFLFNVINPNKMEQYISMYLCSCEKSVKSR